MAFLDNSGDIVLDAVLTDLGRKRMAEGNFRITQFALGDDEIDYRIYNKNHPSGSAYYDLEILQTPVLEAFASSNANINYGLVSFNGNMNLLYMPSLKVWNKTIDVEGPSIQRTSGSVYYIGSSDTTGAALLSALNTDFGSDAGSTYYQTPGSATTAIYIETGIDSINADPPRTVGRTNKQTFLTDQGLLDSNFDISMDTRFLIGVGGINPGTSMWSVTETGEARLQIASGEVARPGVNRIGVANYGTAIVPSIVTQVSALKDGASSNDVYSMINGPSGVITLLHFNVHTDLISSSAKYALHGKTGQDLFGDGNTYDYIDTTVYAVGKTSGVTVHIPIRITRKV